MGWQPRQGEAVSSPLWADMPGGGGKRPTSVASRLLNTWVGWGLLCAMLLTLALTLKWAANGRLPQRHGPQFGQFGSSLSTPGRFLSSLDVPQARLASPSPEDSLRSPLSQPSQPGTASGTPAHDPCYKGSCHTPTASGFCPQQLFSSYDQAFQNLWPGQVDLLVRTYLGGETYRLQIMLRSVELFWPKGVGEVVVVLDEGDQWGSHLIPAGCKVFYENNYLRLPGKVLQQWSYHWADNYTTAPFISIMDDDAIFILKVTPGLLFNLTDGKPYGLAHMHGNDTREWRGHQHDVWEPSTSFFVGRGTYAGNFMVNLPFTFPRAALPRFRAHVGSLYPQLGRSFDRAMLWWNRSAPFWDGKYRDYLTNQIAHTTLGNFMANYMNDTVHVVKENSDATPIPRCGLHLSYIPELDYQTGMRQGRRKSFDPLTFQKSFLKAAGDHLQMALCESFPGGELPGCAGTAPSPREGLSKRVWRYIERWQEWEQMFLRKDPNATALLDSHGDEMTCLYRQVVATCTAGAAWAPSQAASCIRRDSSFSVGQQQQ